MVRIGIDIGGTFLKAGVVTEDGNILATAARPTGFPRPVEDIIKDIAGAATDAVAKAGLTLDDVSFVGCGCPGTVNQQTRLIEYAGNLGFKQTPLVGELEKLLGKPVMAENDANAAMLGEWKAGAARGTQDCVCITLGTGVGGGVIAGGKMVRGVNSAGAELGHTVIDFNGVQCNCGRKGCWEAYASVTALIRQTQAAMMADLDSAMWQLAPTLEEVSGRTAWDAMRAGDETGKAVVDQYIEFVGVGVVNMINVFQPEVLCIGGAISKEGDRLLQPLMEKAMIEHYSKYSEKQTKICRCELGNDAGIIGAAFLDQV
ncbi:MAG: ROK family protein [Clostridia bacterium]|nr:ROK family protein [Clostridia bacterium]